MFFTVPGRYAGLVIVAIALVVAPVLWRIHFRASGADPETNCWRFGRR